MEHYSFARPIFDAHCDTIGRVVDDGVDILARTSDGHIDIPRLIEAHVGCQVFASYVSHADAGSNPMARARRLLSAVQALGLDDRVIIPHSAEEFSRLVSQHDKVGVLSAIENGEALGGEAGVLPELKAAGVRYITLTWGDNDLGGGAFGDGRGLSARGREVVAEMGRQHMLVDLSHASDATLADVLSSTNVPVIASHSNARALCSSARNLTDEQARAIAATGGVIGVTFVSGFLSERSWQAELPFMARVQELARGETDGYIDELRRIDEELATLPRSPLTAIVEQVEHLVEVAGIEHVGFGSDFDGFSRGPTGLCDCRDSALILDLLRRRGFTGSDLDKICWDNWARVFAWTFA